MSSQNSMVMIGNRKTFITGIIAITTPLGFYLAALLIVETVIGVVLLKSNLDSSQKFYGLLLAAGACAFEILVVTALVWFKAPSLMYNQHELDFRSFEYEVEKPEGEI